jgi:exopolysaccharide production protein ExoZ
LFFREKHLPVLLALWAIGLVAFNGLANWQDFNPALKIMLHPYALEFITGSALALFFYSKHSAKVPTPWVWTTLLIALLAGFPLIYGYKLFFAEGLVRMLSVGLVFGAVVGSLALLERRKLIRVPTFLVFTGDMSYTIYLSHLLVLGVIGHLWQRIGAWPDSPWDNALFLLLMMAAVLCYGALAYRFFEKPVLDWATAYCARTFAVSPRRPQTDSAK